MSKKPAIFISRDSILQAVRWATSNSGGKYWGFRDYEVEPPKKIVRWLWAIQPTGAGVVPRLNNTNGRFMSEEESTNLGVPLIKLEWSRTEFDE